MVSVELGQSPGPEVAQATLCSAAEPRGMKPYFPGAYSDQGSYRRREPRNDPERMNKFTARKFALRTRCIPLIFRVVPQRSEERSRHSLGNHLVGNLDEPPWVCKKNLC